MKDKTPTDKAKKAGGVSNAKADAKSREGNNPFDIWLSRKLSDMFDQVAQEPLPNELLELVKKLEEKEQKTNGVQAASPATSDPQAPTQDAAAALKKSKAH
jgi:hypothetical protein